MMNRKDLEGNDRGLFDEFSGDLLGRREYSHQKPQDSR